MRPLALLFTLSVVLVSTAAWAGPNSVQQPTASESDNAENGGSSLYGYVTQVAVAANGAGLTVVAVHHADTSQGEWETVPICGRHAAELKATVGHWTNLVYSSNPNTSHRGFCRNLVAAHIVQ